MMNVLQRCVLTLYSYDDCPDDISIRNVLRQSMELIAQFPLIAAYGYQGYKHYYQDKSLIIHNPKPGLSTAENFLRLIRADKKYTELEAQVLDICLVLHSEHGGGNNSTFTTHVISSTGTDTYSTVAGSLGSLKGPKHGGANLKVQQMMDDLKAHVKDWSDEAAIREYLQGLLDKKGFDHSGLIYGMGHAVYTVSDPRAKILKRYAGRLAEEKVCRRNSSCTQILNVSPWNSLLRNETPLSRQMSISTVDLYIVCLIYRSNCSLRSSQSQELLAGVHIE